jgi:hypothetical protein
MPLSTETKAAIKLYCWGILYDPDRKDAYQRGLEESNGPVEVVEQANQIFLNLQRYDKPIHVCDIQDGQIVI